MHKEEEKVIRVIRMGWREEKVHGNDMSGMVWTRKKNVP